MSPVSKGLHLGHQTSVVFVLFPVLLRQLYNSCMQLERRMLHAWYVGGSKGTGMPIWSAMTSVYS